ncbi:hypothetical protein C0992_011982 [Termitomyces sp. T32_za158]|nr:hypothetical protein C0992_011982 [Termitomyces sp. T32_za158]
MPRVNGATTRIEIVLKLAAKQDTRNLKGVYTTRLLCDNEEEVIPTNTIQKSRARQAEVQDEHDPLAIRGTVRYKWEKPDLCRPTSSPSQETTQGTVKNDSRNVQYWNYKVDRTAKRLAKIVGQSAFYFLESLYTTYLDTKSNTSIFNAIVIVTKLQSNIRNYQGEILQLAGMTQDWKNCEEVSKNVSKVLRSLEDLGYHASLEDDYRELPKLHQTEQLLYQSLLL